MEKEHILLENAKDIASRIRMLQRSHGIEPSRKLTIEKEYQKVRKEALDVFKFVADIAAATIIGKRVIVPFIATPLANIVKGKMGDHKHKDDHKVEEKHEIDHDDDDDVKEIDD